jgi:AraC-like DNA-binding protein
MVSAVPTYSQVATLHREAGLSLVAYTCRGADPPGRPAEEFCAESQIVFVRAGCFVRSSPSGRTLADASQAVFFQRGLSYRVHHPHAGGDECVALSIPDADRLAWMESWGASTARGSDSPMPWESGLVASPSARALYYLVADLQRGLDRFECHARVMHLLDGIQPIASRTGARPAGPRQHLDVVEGVRMVLLQRLGDPLRLPDIARSFGTTPFALCRMFVRSVGLPLHRYRRRLRLREALRRLADGERDITRLALDLGFSDHSHFTNAFGAEFAVPPSAFRSAVTAHARVSGK